MTLVAFRAGSADRIRIYRCSYNAVNGVPSCADTYLLQDILRDFWGFTQDRWVSSTLITFRQRLTLWKPRLLLIVTQLVSFPSGFSETYQLMIFPANIYDPHDYTPTPQQAVADALMAGTDIDCGTFYSEWLPTAYNESLITETQLKAALTRQYASLVRRVHRICIFMLVLISIISLGYFDPVEFQPYRTYGWDNVNTPEAQQLAYQAAVEGIVLLKNDGTLPLSSSVKKIALIGPWANATTQMQGNYEGIAPYLISPLMGAVQYGYQVTYVLGTSISTTDASGFTAAVQAAQEADVIIYAGGIDLSIEAEGLDRLTITWPGNQLELIAELQGVGKPLVVVQFGGGQLDDTTLNGNASVSYLLQSDRPSSRTNIIWPGQRACMGRIPGSERRTGFV